MTSLAICLDLSIRLSQVKSGHGDQDQLDMHVCILFLAGVNIQKKLSNKEVSAIGMIIVAAGRYMCVCVYT